MTVFECQIIVFPDETGVVYFNPHFIVNLVIVFRFSLSTTLSSK